MKRFLLFTGQHYYPDGGWDDFKGDFESYEHAKDFLIQHNDYDWWHLVDSTTKTIVAKGNIA